MAEDKTIYGDGALAADPTSHDSGSYDSEYTGIAKSGASLLYPNLPSTQEGDDSFRTAQESIYAQSLYPAPGQMKENLGISSDRVNEFNKGQMEMAGVGSGPAPVDGATVAPSGIGPEQRAQARVDRALQQVLSNCEAWADKSIIRSYPKCNEFVYDAHVNGDPKGSEFPTVPQEQHNILNNDYYKLYGSDRRAPTVDNFADPQFAPDRLEYIADMNQVRKGDIIVWYDKEKGVHHSAIAAGDGKVIYASSSGAKIETIEYATDHLRGVTPIIRRFE